MQSPLTRVLIHHNSSGPAELGSHQSAPWRLTRPGGVGGFRGDVDKAQKVHFSLRWSSRFPLAGSSRQVTGPTKEWPQVSACRKEAGGSCSTRPGWQAAVAWQREVGAVPGRPWARRPPVSVLRERQCWPVPAWCHWCLLSRGHMEPPNCYCRVRNTRNRYLAGPPPRPSGGGRHSPEPLLPQNVLEPSSGADGCAVPTG